VAAAVENSAGFDNQAWRMDFAGDDAFGLNFDAAFGENYSVEAAGDNYLIAFDLAFHFGTFAEDEGLIAEDVAFDLSFDAQRARKFQGAFKAHGPIEEAGPFTLRLRHASMIRERPSHGTPLVRLIQPTETMPAAGDTATLYRELRRFNLESPDGCSICNTTVVV
jgi:hypothetical protein